MSLVATIPTRSVSIWRNIPSIVASGMKTVALGAALSASEPGAQEKQHGSGEQQSQNAEPYPRRTVHSPRPVQFLGSLTVPSA